MVASTGEHPGYSTTVSAAVGMSFFAATFLLVAGIPVALVLSGLIRWISRSRAIARPVAIALSLAAGVPWLLIIVKFDLDLVRPETLGYFLPWLLYGAFGPFVEPRAQMTLRDAD